MWNACACTDFFWESNDEQQDGVLVCDYEENCTQLFRRIERKEWGPIKVFLESGYWPYFVIEDRVPPAEQVRTWVMTMDLESTEPKVKEKQLPLHLALVLRAPAIVLQLLIDLYPASASNRDTNGRLPLDLALAHSADDAIVLSLLEVFPNAVQAKNNHYPTVLQYASKRSKNVCCRIVTKFGEENKVDKNHANPESLQNLSNEQLATLTNLLVLLEQERLSAKSVSAQRTARLAIANQELEQLEDSLRQAQMSLDIAKSLKLSEIQPRNLCRATEEKERVDLLEPAFCEAKGIAERLGKDVEFMRTYMDDIQVYINRTFDIARNDDIEGQVNALKTRRIHHDRERATIEVDILKQKLHNKLNHLHVSCTDDIEAAKMVLKGLDSSNLQEESHEDLMELETELVPVQKELKRDEDKERNKKELQLIRRLLENELQQQNDMATDDLEHVKSAIVSLKFFQMEKAHLRKLLTMKQETQTIKNNVQFKVLIRQTKRELSDMKAAIEEQLLKSPESESEAALSSMIVATSKMCFPDIGSRNIEEVLSLRQELISLRAKLGQIKAFENMKRELRLLALDVKKEMKNSTGVNNSGLAFMRRTIADMMKVPFAAHIRADLTSMSEEIQRVRISSWREDVEVFKQAKAKLYRMRFLLTSDCLADSHNKSGSLLHETVGLKLQLFIDSLASQWNFALASCL